jgi:hypothetical protein
MSLEKYEEPQAVLSCWKDIAHYMGKGVRTVQRWEQELSMPVRRPNGAGPKGPVTARKSDLDQWLAAQWSERKVVSPSFPDESPVLPIIMNSASLIQTSRQLREKNKLLVEGIRSTIQNLHVTCTSFELTPSHGKE